MSDPELADRRDTYLLRKAKMIWAEGRDLPLDLHTKLTGQGYDVATLENLYRQ